MRTREPAFLIALTLMVAPSTGRADAPLTKGPFFIDVGDTSARVMFETAAPENVTLRVLPRNTTESPDEAVARRADAEAQRVETPELAMADAHEDALGPDEAADYAALARSETQANAAQANAAQANAAQANAAQANAAQANAAQANAAQANAAQANAAQANAAQANTLEPTDAMRGPANEQTSGVFTREGASFPWRRDGRAIGLIRVTGLSPGTEYEVELVAAGGTASATFRTAPVADEDLSFLVYGDNRTQHDEHRRVIVPMLREPDVRFLLHTGDMVEMGGRPVDWDEYFDIAGPLLRTLPIFPSLGNHEIYGPGGGLAYLRHLAAPGTREAYYERRYGPLRIFSLDSNDSWLAGSPQVEWLRDRLAEPTDARFTFAIVHHSPISSGPHGGHEAMVASGALELMRSGGVDLLFAGHDHMYERGDADGFKYIVTGGGGAPLYRQNRALDSQLAFMPTYHYLRVDVRGDEVSVSAVGSDGELLERCAFDKGEPWRCEDGTPQGPVWEGEPFQAPPPAWRSWAASVFAALVVLGLVMLWRSRRRSV